MAASVPLSSVMSSPVVVLQASQTLAEAADVLSEHGFGGVAGINPA